MVDLWSDSSADSVASGESIQLKYPCRISNKEEVFMLARAIFILLIPSHLSWAAILQNEWPVPKNSNPENKRREIALK